MCRAVPGMARLGRTEAGLLGLGMAQVRDPGLHSTAPLRRAVPGMCHAQQAVRPICQSYSNDFHVNTNPLFFTNWILPQNFQIFWRPPFFFFFLSATLVLIFIYGGILDMFTFRRRTNNDFSYQKNPRKMMLRLPHVQQIWLFSMLT